MNMLSTEQKNKIKDRANQLISEEMTLHDLRTSSEKDSKSIIKGLIHKSENREK